ncbi:hypothetical protein BOTBODRAFT_578738 [Botryobasidium botryosum FD-172 SS1]|uniref:Uncharacterized protein n=1 Tax=Botryobasidium botryosum (strain FD-172 SS1) TaxID=930990 RepID=A0A067N0B1_BOTB1|nr:hypothetical protein BOTBODRAFT_578738 [Botryobasidium botryosum FD-172 SS1]
MDSNTMALTKLSLHLQVLCMGAGLAICCGALCWDKSRQIGLEDFQKMHEHYVESGTGARVSAAIKEGFDDIGPYDTMGQRAKLLQIILDNKVTGV